MNLEIIDLVIIAGLMLFVLAVATYTKKYTRSVADFLAANRCAGRYMLTIAEGEANLGAISLLAILQMYYQVGFAAVWWSLMSLPIGIIISLTGWVTYRFRQTRAFSLAQFFEQRYSRNFRIFMGIVMFVTGVINFGIFPAVGSNFFIYFCGLPDHFPFLGLSIPMFPTLMALLLTVSLYFTFAGGQIAVMVTDFIQGLFASIVIIIILVFIFISLDWSQVTEALLMAPEGASLINPHQGGKVEEDFNFWYFAMLAVLSFYRHKSWQGTQGYNCAALSPHEAKMGAVLGSLRGMSQNLLLVMLAVAALTLMRHPDFSHIATQVNGVLDTIGNDETRNQMIVPAVMSRFLCPGLVGAFCAVFLAAFISTHDTYLHSWGSIFIQDVVMPFRKSPLAPKKHMTLLRLAIIGVAVFIFFFSLLFQQKQHILLWFAITAAIYGGGAGAAIIGGLYWKRGTTTAAYAGMIVGAVLSLVGIVIRQFNEDFFLNGMEIAFWTSLIALITYITVSLSERRISNLDKLLHRGQYAKADDVVVDDIVVHDKGAGKILRKLGFTAEFTRGDKLLYGFVIAWTLFWFGIFVVGNICYFVFEISTEVWAKFWLYYVWITMLLGVPITIWLAIGGIIDVRRMFRRLSKIKRDEHDDGWVDNKTLD
jgi:solute:Na+ symporter, SSS family